MSVAMTCAPSWNIAMALARPMPWPAAVTRQVLFFSRSIAPPAFGPRSRAAPGVSRPIARGCPPGRAARVVPDLRVIHSFRAGRGGCIRAATGEPTNGGRTRRRAEIAGIGPPHNIEAEQALLGALLVNNDVFDRVAAIVQAEHFYEPVHARIFEVAANRIQKNALASPVTLKAFFEDDEGLRELGGPAYLARLAGASISLYAARDYAQLVYDLAIRRELIALGQEIADEGRRGWTSTASRATRSSRPSRRSTSSASRARSTRASRASCAPRPTR